MRRSLLFIPGNNPSMLVNCDVFEADTVIIDLEDAVAVEQKDSARNLVAQYLAQYTPSVGQVMIRVNATDTQYFYDDVMTAVRCGAHSIMLPKAMPEDLVQLDSLLTQLEARFSAKPLTIVPIVELAQSLVKVNEIATSARVDGILLGAEDYTRDMEIQRTSNGEEIFYARNCIAVACKAARIQAIDTPFTSTNDTQGLQADCQTAKRLGLSAKACIHPNQVDVVNKCFSPTQQEIQHAMRVMLALEQATKQGKGAFGLDGKMVDKPIIDRASTTLQKAKELGLI